jgi:hypothetical protein
MPWTSTSRPPPCDAPCEASSSYLLDELALHGYRPFDGEPDPRPLPSADLASIALESAAESLSNLFFNTRLEADLPDLLWFFVNLFHRKAGRIDRDLDDNETAQRRSQAEQDGSEIRSVELEQLIAQGLTLTERRNAFEFFRDNLAELYAAETGSAWRPRSGSKVNHRALTAAMMGLPQRQEAGRDAGALAARIADRICWRSRLQRSSADLGSARQGSCEASRHGPSPWRRLERRRTDRVVLGGQSQGSPSRLQTGLEPSQERRSVQAQ